MLYILYFKQLVPHPVVIWLNSRLMVCTEWNRTEHSRILEYKKDRHNSDQCTYTILDNLNKVQYPDKSSKSSGFIKPKASQSQRTCETISDACLHLSYSVVFTSPSLCITIYMQVCVSVCVNNIHASVCVCVCTYKYLNCKQFKTAQRFLYMLTPTL